MSGYDRQGSSTREAALGQGPQTGQGHPPPVPGKHTLVQQLPVNAPASSPTASAPGQAADVHGAAAHGIAGASHPLPFAGDIQSLFGHHDVRGIEAHTDAPAAAGARAMGAEAFATGNHVAFASTPDLHTAAHEAAHVVQQRAGVHLKGGVGEAGDAHENHANQVADRIVAGRSAEDLLDRYAAGTNRGASAAPTPQLTDASGTAVQRQATATPPTPQPPSASPASGAPASTPGTGTPPPPSNSPAEAYHASTSAHDPNAPASRNAGWGSIQAAATEKPAQQALDIEWIDALPAHLKDTIDEAFADSAAKATAARAATADPELKKIDREIGKEEKDLRAAAIERLAASDPSIKHKHGETLDKALAKDPEYATAKKDLEDDRKQRRQARTEEIRAAADGPMPAGRREDTVTTPAGTMVTRPQGKALARTNFMSWAVDVLGSTEAAKRHFLSIREVSRQPGMFLIEPAKARFEAARAVFEAKHPGYTFPSTDVAQSLRGFHQARQGIGMLGHALGVAFDLLAYDNPNQKLAGTGGNYGYLLDRAGGDGNKHGRSVMQLGADGENTIAQLGRDTTAGRSTPTGEAMVERIHAQFDEMVATSERLKASMAGELPSLASARDEYFNSRDTEKELAQATRNEKDADKIADRRMKEEKFQGDDAAKATRRQEIRAELRERRRQLQADLDAGNADVKQVLSQAFVAWIAMIQAELADADARQATSDAELAAQAQARQDLDAIDVHASSALDALNAFADAHQLQKPGQVPRAAAYKVLLKKQLAAKQKPRGANDPLSPTYIHYEIAVLKTWQARLRDPKFVFGEGKVVPAAAPAGGGATPGPASTNPGGSGGPGATTSANVPASTTDAISAQPGAAAPAPAGGTTSAASGKHWATKMQVTNAPIMQLVEHGFIRHDDMPARTGAKDMKQVFNAEVATTLARFGFSPGATYRDTMHFDFIEGYSAAPGGRGQPNMDRTKYGPSGDIPLPAPKTPATPSAPKKDGK